MDEDDKLRSTAQKAEQAAADENQQKVAQAKEGSMKPKENFDSSVLDAWTAGIETPHSFAAAQNDDSEVKRVESPQEHMFDIMKKEEDKKKNAAEEIRLADAK